MPTVDGFSASSLTVMPSNGAAAGNPPTDDDQLVRIGPAVARLERRRRPADTCAGEALIVKSRSVTLTTWAPAAPRAVAPQPAAASAARSAQATAAPRRLRSTWTGPSGPYRVSEAGSLRLRSRGFGRRSRRSPGRSSPAPRPRPRPPRRRRPGRGHLVLHLHRLDDADDLARPSTLSPTATSTASTVPCIGLTTTPAPAPAAPDAARSRRRRASSR